MNRSDGTFDGFPRLIDDGDEFVHRFLEGLLLRIGHRRPH